MAASGDIQDMIKNLQVAIIQSNQVVFEEKEQLKLKIQELTEENAILREANSKFTCGVPHAALQDLKNKIERLKSDFELERNIHANEKQVLKSQIESFTEERAKLTETIIKLEVESNRLLKDVKNLNEQNIVDIPYLKGQLLEYTSLKEALDAENPEIEFIRLMESKLTESNKKIEELESQLLKMKANFSAQKTELDKQMVLHNSQLESAKETESKLVESNQKNEELEAQLLQLQADLSSQKNDFEKLLILHNGQLESAKETESKLTESNKKNEELEAQFLQLQDDLSAQKTELEKQMVLRNFQIELAKETETKLAESNKIQVDLKAQLQQADLSVEKTVLKNHKDVPRSQLEWAKETESKLEESTKINKYLEAKFSQQDSIFLEKTEFQELMDLYRSISDFVQENVSKLVETNALNDSLKVKIQQLSDELSVEITGKEALLDSYNILLESTKITEAKLVETTELNESLRAKLFETQDELSTERLEIIELLDLCKNQVESAQESETKLAETINQNEALKCELLQLDNYLSLERSELECQLHSHQDLLEFLKEVESKLVETSKFIGELNVTQLLQLQDKLSDHSTELLEEIDAYKNQLESANVAKSKLAEEVITVLNSSSKPWDSPNKNDLSMNISSSKEDLSDTFSKSSKCLQTIADPELPKVLDEVTNGLVDFIKCRGESDEEKPTENIKLVGEDLQTLDQTQMYITLLKENLKDYRNQLCGQNYTQPSKYLEYGPSGIYLTSVEHQLKLNELVNKFNVDVLIKQNEISSSSNLKLSPEISGATLSYLKAERFYYLAFLMVYSHICTKNKLTITDKDCQEVAANLKLDLKDLKNSMVELKKKLQTTTSVKDQAEINSKIKEIGLKIIDVEGKLHYTPTLFKNRQADRVKEAIKHKCAAESFYQAQKFDLDIEDQLQTELKTPGLAREVLDSFNDLLKKILFELGTLSCEALHFVNEQISNIETNLSSDATNQDMIQYLEYLKTARTEIESQSKSINDQIPEKICDENLVEMAKNITKWESRIFSVKGETKKRICEGLIDEELDSLKNKFKSFAKSLNIDSKKAEDFFRTICKFEREKSNLQTFTFELEKENLEIQAELVRMEKELKETLEKYENIKKNCVCLNVNNPSASKSEGADLTRLEKALADKNSENICLEDDKQKLVKEIAALKKKSQKMADTKETEKSDLKKEIKTLEDEKIKLQKNIDKLKLDINKLKEKHSRQNSELEESFKRDLINAVQEKNKIMANYEEIKIKYNEYNDEIRSKNAEIKDLKQKMEAKCDSLESENLKHQIQQDRNLFRQRQKQLEDKIQKLLDENQNLKESNIAISYLLESDASRELKLQNEIADLKKTELKMQKLISDNKISEASLKLQLQHVIADSKKTELKMQQLMVENNTSETSLKLQLQHVIAGSKKTELKMQQLMADNKASEATLKLQLQHVIAGSKETELKMQQLKADSKASEASLKLQLQNVEGNAKTAETIKQLQSDFERAIYLVQEVENVIYEILENDLSCPICHESMVQSNILNCNHSFCEACIRDWSKNMQRQCPVCHSPILMQKQAAFLDTMIKNLSSAYEKLNDFANNFSNAVAASKLQ